MAPPPGPCPPWPPWPPKKRSKKSSKGLASSSPLGTPRRRRGVLMVDSVLMLTTLGSSCFAICENWLESICGEGTLNIAASEEDDFLSWPFTPCLLYTSDAADE